MLFYPKPNIIPNPYISSIYIFFLQLKFLTKLKFGLGDRTPSPRQRQVSYSELWNVNHTGETSLCDLSCNKDTIVICAEFSPDSTKIVAASSDKMITVSD